jgi:hypothetical protein
MRARDAYIQSAKPGKPDYDVRRLVSFPRNEMNVIECAAAGEDSIEKSFEPSRSHSLTLRWHDLEGRLL